VTEVEFDSENTAFIVSSDSSIADYESKFSNIIENWEHYDYHVGTIKLNEE